MTEVIQMNDQEFLKELCHRGAKADDAYFQFAHIVACLLPKSLHEQLNQLVNGPVYDGDVISKRDRDTLLSLRLGVRVCVKGEEGYTGGSYFAYSVNKEIGRIKRGEVGA